MRLATAGGKPLIHFQLSVRIISISVFLSFIIPLYNAEQYIADCIESILECTLPSDNYEILVIDDGSTDAGAEIVSDYAMHQDNIRLYQQANRGASAARNRGVAQARGEYLWFVDADDKIDASVLSYIYNRWKADNHADLYCFNHTRVMSHGPEQVEEFHTGGEMDGCSYILSHPYFYLWNKIFRKASIGNVRFPDGTRNTEDWYFDLATIIDMQRVVCLPQNGYFYNTVNMSSTLRTRTPESIRRNSEDSQLMHLKILELIQQTTDAKKCKALCQTLNYSIAGFFYALYADRVALKDVRHIINCYRQVGLYPVARTFSQRANKFLAVANRPVLFYIAVWLHGLIRW